MSKSNNPPSVGTIDQLAGKVESNIKTVELPLGELGNGYVGCRRVDINRIEPVQARNIRRLLRGLQDSGATLANGKPVKNPQDVFKWIIDQIS